MHLRGRQGTELELSLTGYQFPDDDVDPWDSNGLLVAVRAVSPQASWDVVDPCLTTWEAARVARWLGAIGRGADLQVGRAVGLNEPNVTLVARPRAAQPDRVDLRVCFALETRPPWLKAVAGTQDLCVELDTARSDLTRAAADLRADLDRFPQRGADPTA